MLVAQARDSGDLVCAGGNNDKVRWVPLPEGVLPIRLKSRSVGTHMLRADDTC